jgi:hypothetical protein
MLFLPPANGRRTAYLGPIEDAAFVATMWALWWHSHLALLAIPIILLPTALGSFILMGVELGCVRADLAGASAGASPWPGVSA